MFVNIIKSYRDIVAVCDKELIGKKFEEPFEGGVKQLDIKENFYKGEESDRDNVKEIMKKMAKEDATFNIVGKDSVAAAIEAGIISEKEINKIKEIPFALVLS
jgi:hypothetical protein